MAVNQSNKQAAALIVAIWVVGLLSLLVGSFAFQAHLEARITSYYRKRLQAETLAKAGVERARVLMVYSTEARRRLGSDPSAEEMEKPFWQEARHLARGIPVRLSEQLGPGTIHLTIAHEPARININRINEADWARILELCRVPERLWDGLIDAFMDWTAPQEQPRLDGVDPEYYLDMDPPYKPRGAPVESIDELLMIRGFTREIVYGGMHEDALTDDPTMTGLSDLFTTFGENKINVNAASRRVLMAALPGLDETTAQDIIYEREGAFLEEWQRDEAGFNNLGHFRERFPGLAAEAYNRILFAYADYRISSVGEVDGVARGVWLTARFAGNDFIVLQWRESDRYH